MNQCKAMTCHIKSYINKGNAVTIEGFKHAEACSHSLCFSGIAILLAFRLLSSFR